MGTKINPGKFDCYDNALPNEPMFIMLARDPLFYEFVTAWAKRRGEAINCGDRPQDDSPMVSEAMRCAGDGATWRRQNLGKWRS